MMYAIVAVVIFLVSAAAPEVDISERMQQYTETEKFQSGSPIQSFLDREDETDDFDVVQPARLDSDGKFLTHDVRYVSPLHDLESSPRKRRHVDANRYRRSGARLLYRVPFGGHIITVNVTENDKLLRESFVIERITNGNDSSGAGITSSMSRGTRWPCHFQGHIEGQPGSRVALSTCHGLTGLLMMEEGDFFIEPVKVPKVDSESSEEDKEAKPHKIYRRDLSSIIEKAQPLLHLKKATSRGKKAKSHRSVTPDDAEASRGGGDDDARADESYHTPLPSFSDESQEEFCGVTDTRRKYRHMIKKREQWESRRLRTTGKTLTESDHTTRRKDLKRRSKRSVSVDRRIEMLVVVDKKMVEYYEAFDHGNVERYVLTIINIVSELFHDASIGNSLHVSLVRLILLEEEEKGLKISQRAESTLDNFCRWAKKVNPKGDDHPNHHDVAVLLTRRDICSNSNKSCETLGLAHVAGMCQSHRSCNVNQDTGLSLAYTVAHELGHNFAMHHDGQLNDCKSSAKYNHVMAPHLTSSSLPMRWSSCSRRYITRFLDRNWGFCLNDEPAEHDFEMPTNLPGVVYDANHQCRLMFGEKSRHCYGLDDVCHRLWCFVDGSCRSRLHAAAAGTGCGSGKWCFAGKCVPVGKRPYAVDGGWSDWTEWSSCSRTCGIGVKYSMRHCDQPMPRNGGSYCLGERKRYKTCSKWKCERSEDAPKFREQQCSVFDKIKYRNLTLTWKPVESPLYPCELQCFTQIGKTMFADRLRDKVVDGTRCYPGSNDICVDGICRRLGCDNNIGSRAMEDRCGVCHGDGSSCYEVKDVFTRKMGEEYTPAAVLPRGSRNVEVREIMASGNFLALRNVTDKKHYYLNGNYMIQWSTKFQLSGTQFTYNRINETTDVITATGPLVHDVMVMILYREKNPGVSLSYTMPYNITAAMAPDEFPEFRWKIKEWTACSRECGKGEQLSVAVCEEKRAGIVEDFFCNETAKPVDKRRPCNDFPCPPRWWAAPWQACSVTCGGGVGVQHRLVICVRSVGEDEQIALEHSECFNIIRPVNKRRCSLTTEIPCPRWRAEDWKECSKTCGSGVSNRAVQCVTYVMNDVIKFDINNESELNEFDVGPNGDNRIATPLKKATIPGVDSIPGQESKFPTIDGKTSISDDLEILPYDDEILLGMGIVATSMELDPLQRDFDNELDDYDVEKDEKCDFRTRPETLKSCNTERCPVLTSTMAETETTTKITTELYSSVPTAEVVSGSTKPKSETPTETNAGEINEDYRDGPTTPKQADTNEMDNVATDSGLFPSGMLQKTPGNGSDVDVLEDEYTSEPGTVSDDEFDLDNDITMLPESDLYRDDDDIILDDNTNDDFDITRVDNRKPTEPKNDSARSEPPTRASTDKENVTKHIRSDVTTPEIEEPHNTVPISQDDDFKEEDIAEEDIMFIPVIKKIKVEKKSTTAVSKTNATKTESIVVTTKLRPSPTTTITPPPQTKTTKPHTNHPITTHLPTSSTAPFKAEWIVGEWGKCSTTCGVGAKFRTVSCNEDEIYCDKNHRPAPAKICNLGPCAKWVYSEWTKCTTLCGVGIRSKKTECVDERTEKVLRPHHCSSLDPIAPINITCRQQHCMPWKTSRWTSCSSPCGPGTQRRRTACSRQNQCDPATRPHEKKSCFLKKCVEWRPLEWNRCSVHCGGGLQRRKVICVEQATGRTTNSSYCNPNLLPKKVKKCNDGQCPAADYDFSNCHKDRLSPNFCTLLQKLGRCVQPSLAIQCCVTCKTYLSIRHKNRIS